MLTLVVGGMNFLVNGVNAVFFVTHDGVFFPAVPQFVAGLQKFARHFIALGVRRQIVTAEVARRIAGE
ncbi:hypothetical protein D3C79_1034780 [compost metagenome]